MRLSLIVIGFTIVGFLIHRQLGLEAATVASASGAKQASAVAPRAATLAQSLGSGSRRRHYGA